MDRCVHGFPVGRCVWCSDNDTGGPVIEEISEDRYRQNHIVERGIEMNLAEKTTIALEGVTLTQKQANLLKVRLSKLLDRKRPEQITVPEIQGLTEIVQSVMPAGVELLLEGGER